MSIGNKIQYISRTPQAATSRPVARLNAGRSVTSDGPSPRGPGEYPMPVRSYGGFGIRTADGGGSNVDRLEPMLRNPLLSASNFQMPQTSLELNQWIRYWDRFHPLIGNSLDMHATVPFSRFELQGVTDPYVLQYYEDMCDEMNLFRHILEISREFDLMGEVFPFLVWDDEMGGWCDALVLNPDYVMVIGVMLGGRKKGFRYELQIDHQTRAFMQSPDPLDQEIVQELDPAIVRAAQSGMNAPLDKFNVEHLMRTANPYDYRGVSIVMGCLKDLMYEEQLREAQYQIAGGISRPREIWKLGGQDYTPSQRDLSDLRTMLSDLRNDPNGVIVSHHSLNVDFLQAERRILPIGPEMERIEERILTRLFTSKATTTGQGPTYANASVAMQILDARYALKRDFIIDYIRRKVFLPVALNNEFREAPKSADINGPGPYFHPSANDRPLLIPDFHWLSKVNLTDRQQQMSYLMTLQQSVGLPLKMICNVLQIDYEEMVSWMKRERGTIADPAVYAAYRARVQAESLMAAKRDGGIPHPSGSGPAAGGGASEVADDVESDVETDLDEIETDIKTDVNTLGAEDRKSEQKEQPKPPKVSMNPAERAADGGWRPRRIGHRSSRRVRT